MYRFLLLIFILFTTFYLPCDPVQLTFSEAGDYFLDWSPDSTRIASMSNRAGSYGMWITPVSGEEPAPLEVPFGGDFDVSWSPDSRWIAFDGYPNVTEGPLDIYKILSSGGDPIRLTFNIYYHPSWSPFDDRIVCMHQNQVAVIDSSGQFLYYIANNSYDKQHPDWSGDGSNILYSSMRAGNMDIWIAPAQGGTPSQFTDDPAWDDRGVWSPDGDFVAFVSDRGPGSDENIWVKSLDGTYLEQITFYEGYDSQVCWSPCGTKLAFTSGRGGNHDIWIADVSYLGLDKTHNYQDSKKTIKLEGWPNPFDRQTTISFYLDKDTNAKCAIYNAKGQLVKTLNNGYLSGGIHNLTWDGESNNGQKVSQGVYFFKIDTEDAKDVKSLFLLK